MAQPLRIHLIAGFPYDAKREFLAELRRRVAVWEPERGRPEIDDNDVALVLPGYVEPGPLVEAWANAKAAAAWAGRPAKLESTTVVLDTEHVERDLHTKDLLAERGWAARARDTRSVPDLLFEQIESADQIVLEGGREREAPEWIRVLNPCAKISDTFAALRRVSEGTATATAWPRAAWRRVRDGLPLPPGFPQALVYRRRRPFDQVRFQHWLLHESEDVLRAKGNVWLANNPDLIFVYSKASAVQRLFVAGRWSESATSAWDSSDPEQADRLERWDPESGFRQQEIVLLGPTLDADRAAAALDRCLATDAEVEDTSASNLPRAAAADGRSAAH